MVAIINLKTLKCNLKTCIVDAYFFSVLFVKVSFDNQ